MVIEDIHSDLELNKSKKAYNFKENIYLADPMDRGAAFIVDIFIILLPILMLSNAPFKRMIFSSILLDNNYDFIFSIVIGTITSVFTITLYNTLSTYLLGASLGKLFLGIKVVDIWTYNKPRFFTCLLRSTAWWIGVFTFGFSFSSIFTNARRRTLHDRISETIVISEKDKAITKPGIYESSAVKGIFAGFLAFVCVISMLIFYKAHRNLSQNSQISELLEEKGGLCSAVGKAYRAWPIEFESETPRLEVAMALFAAGSINEECLESEATFIFKQDIKSGLGYLAKAFVYSDRIKLSESYQRRVCELDKNSRECSMSKLVADWEEEDWNKISSEFIEVDKSWPLYIQLWAIRNAVSFGDFIFAKKLLQDLPDLEVLKSFKINFKAKAYLADNDASQMDSITDLALSSLEDIEKINLSTWLCYQQISMDCNNANSRSCQYFKNNYDHELLSNTLFSLTALHASYCKGQILSDLESPNRGTRKLQEALKKYKANESVGLDMLWSIYKNTGNKIEVREEAARYFLDKAEKQQDLEKFVILWKTKTQGYEWQKTGHILFNKLNKFKYYIKSVEVGSVLTQFFDKNESFRKDLAMALYHTGEPLKAWQLISSYNKIHPGRSPASQDLNYDEMVDILKREYLKK
ncbi:MAG: RDD family protein [Bdellovibrionaceae bacterium]|nr:RDD family protein [Pseudobdellovibrionaceae bacterium]